jgi:predicted metalloprotease with PDZ domain
MVTINYTIAMPRPETHRFQVTVNVSGWQTDTATLILPVWTPGSYLVREFARHLENFRATDNTGNLLAWERSGKAHWLIQTQGIASFRAEYEIYANDLTVRTSHLDSSHGYFNGANVFMYVEGYKELPVTLTIEAPQGWHSTIALPQDEQGRYLAPDYDLLVDSPGEVGTHRVLKFEALGKPHEIALYGHGNEDEEALVRDMKKTVEGVASMFGSELPYDRYIFFVHIGHKLGGGLEHRNSTVLGVDRWAFSPRSSYEQFLRLAVHEFFHTWNVKRIRPHNLGPFDYTQEVYTPLLWVMEGFTTYYDVILLRRCGFVSARRALQLLGERIANYRQTPGRLVQSVAESSRTTWIKFYRQDENTPNSAISYYLKGSLVALMLDMKFRATSNNTKSLDDVMRDLWQTYGIRDVGFTEQEFADLLQEVGEVDLKAFLAQYVEGIEELPLDHYLSYAGLAMTEELKSDSPEAWTGLKLTTENGMVKVRYVLRDSPAEAAGLMPNDALVALEGYQVLGEDFFNARIRERRIGDTVKIHYFRNAELMSADVMLAVSPADVVSLRPLANPQRLQVEILESWLETSWEEVK